MDSDRNGIPSSLASEFLLNRETQITSGGMSPPPTSNAGLLTSAPNLLGTDEPKSNSEKEDVGKSKAGEGTGEVQTGKSGETISEVQADRLRRLKAELRQPDYRAKIKDEAAEKIRETFEVFLENFTSSESVGEKEYGGEEHGGFESTLKEKYKERPYMMQLIENRLNETNTVHVKYQDIFDYEEMLGTYISENYYRLEKYLNEAAKRVHNRLFRTEKRDSLNFTKVEAEGAGLVVSIYGLPGIHRIRELRTKQIGKLVSIVGTVTRTSEVRPELVLGTFSCGLCQAVVSNLTQQFKYTEPTICTKPQCQNRVIWNLIAEQSVFADWQRIRVQEKSNEIPPGAVPRTIDVILRYEMVESVKPGDTALFTGVLVAVPDVGQLGLANSVETRRGTDSGEGVGGLKALGARELSYKMAFLGIHAAVEGGETNRYGQSIGSNEADLTREEKEEILEMAAMKNTIYNRLVQSLAPTVFGHEEVKRGILLQLMGGVHKRTAEGIKLRGDINVCIVGDPSTSKSQFLKYVSTFMPRAIFTSGKGSSAAGLTASVVKDEETGEFTIEAGALMLADHGICCIDEFDKMDLSDQVAIHEAMEQQTISIAKAGLYASLNARTSILAAANPVGGRYDRRLTLRQNIAMSAPIMSRFDLFFIVLDDSNETTDYNTARHIVSIHQLRDEAIDPPYTTAQLRRYIRYARSISPKISPEAGTLMWETYRNLRQEDAGGNGGSESYRITVRQLESLIRLSEAMARVYCEDFITPRHVREAARLLKKSLVSVEMDDIEVADGTENTTHPTFGNLDPSNNNKVISGPSANAGVDVGTERLVDTSGAQIPQSKIKVKREDFDRIRTMVIFKLRQVEEFIDAANASDRSKDPESESQPQQDPSHDSEANLGMRMSDLVDWYLSQREESLASEEDFTHEMVLVKAVLKYLVDVEGSVITLKAPTTKMDIDEELDDGFGQENPILILHPNFSLE